MVIFFLIKSGKFSLKLREKETTFKLLYHADCFLIASRNIRKRKKNINTSILKYFHNKYSIYKKISFYLQGAFMEALRPPVLLNPNDFSRVYKNNLDVLNANDLHVNPPYCVPCINVYCCDFLAIT